MKVLSNQSVFVDLSPCAEADTRGSLGQLLTQTRIKSHHVLSGRHGGEALGREEASEAPRGRGAVKIEGGGCGEGSTDRRAILMLTAISES